MADQSSVLVVSQLGPEVIPGLKVPATRRLQALGLEINPAGTIEMFGPMGYVVDTMAAPITELTDLKLTGYPCYRTMPYILESLIKKTVASGAGTAKSRVYNPSANTSNFMQSYTFEYGTGEGLGAANCGFGMINALNLEFSRQKVTIGGGGFAQKLTHGINLSTCELQTLTITGIPTGGAFRLTWNTIQTGYIAYNATATGVDTGTGSVGTPYLTLQAALDAAYGTGAFAAGGGPGPVTPLTIIGVGPNAQQNLALITASHTFTGGSTPNIAVAETTPGAGPTDIAPLPILPTHVDFYVDPTFAAVGTTQQDRTFKVKWQFADRTKPLWQLKSSDPSFSSIVIDKLKTDGSIMVGAGTTLGNDLVLAQRAGAARYVRLKCVGDAIAGGGFQTFQIDAAIKIKAPFKYGNDQNVRVLEFPFNIVQDAVASKNVEITSICDLATL